MRSQTQWVTVYWIELTVILYLFGWNLWGARSILFPLKLTAVSVHEGWCVRPLTRQRRPLARAGGN